MGLSGWQRGGVGVPDLTAWQGVEPSGWTGLGVRGGTIRPCCVNGYGYGGGRGDQGWGYLARGLL